MISVAEALEKVTSGVPLLGTEQVAVGDALGRVLAEDLASRMSHPPAAVSAMDGYAVRAGDVKNPPVTLKIIGEAPAGGKFEGSVSAGEAVRIFTGGPVPDGADAIVIQENTEPQDGGVKVLEGAAEGRFIRPEGLDFKKGAVLLNAGTLLSGRDLGLIAAMNIPWLRVRRKPRIAVLATGNELGFPGDPLTDLQIVSSNSVALGAYVEALGGVPVNLGIAKDDEASLLEALESARGADLLVTLGGASVGDYDLVRKVLGDEGLEMTFYKVAMRPGKPLIFGKLGQMPVLGLPGNPVSAGVTSAIFLRPAMGVMLGLKDAGGPEATARLGCDLGENDERQDYLRAAFSHDADGALVATPFKGQDSSMIARLARADCLIVRAPLAKPAKAGESVQILPLRAATVTF